MIKNTALVTGASNGIGLELAKIHASRGGDLVLVARSRNVLEKIKKELEEKYKINVYIIVKDLSIINSAKEIYNETKKQAITINYLINSAGFGNFGMFVDTDWGTELEMINLNIITLTQLTKLYLKDMIKLKNGKIMNVASTAAFQSGPTMAVYYATKAYVLNFSEAVDNEVRDKGITITTLCPGPTKSNFQEIAKMENSSLFKEKNLPTAKAVAEYGYSSMLKGKTVAIHGFKNWVMASSVRFFPRQLIVKITRKIQDS